MNSRASMNLGRENGDGQGGQTFVEVHSSRPLYFGGPDTARILRPKLRTARVPGPEGGPGPEEGVRGRRRPARRAVRPAHPERGGAGARRSRRRRRGRSRLQEPLETESPAAAAGGAHRQASRHRTAGAGGESGPRGHRGAERGVGRPVRGPPPSSQCWEARWREGTEEGRKEGRVSWRAGTGRGPGPRRRGWGREGEGRRDPETDCAPALDGRRPGAAESGGPTGLRLGTRPRDGGGSGRKGLALARVLAAPRPCAPRPVVVGGSGVPSPSLRRCQALEAGRHLGATGAPRPSSLLSSGSFLGLAGGLAAPEPARLWV